MNDTFAPIRDLPRLRLAHLPTPLEAMPRLAAALGVQSLWVKRDDCTGLGLGGNKIRKLEFSLAAAQASGADCVVSGGVVQSNTARQVAAACAKLGMECHLAIMNGRPRNTEPDYATNGNILLDQLYGAIIHSVCWDEDRNRGLQSVASDLSAAGRRVFVVPYGALDALGAMGYALAAEEIIRNCPDVRWIVHGSGSAGTQAGLVASSLSLATRRALPSVAALEREATGRSVHFFISRCASKGIVLYLCLHHQDASGPREGTIPPELFGSTEHQPHFCPS
jgi:L-cysteate sulfo-lyase